MRYFRGTLNYLKRIVLSDSTHIMSMDDPLAISVETLTIDGGCYLEKEFAGLMRMHS